MPMYNFECKSCGNKFEEIIPMNEETCKCSKCGEQAGRLFSPTGSLPRINGYCYSNVYGKHAWRSKMSDMQKADILSDEKKNPY